MTSTGLPSVSLPVLSIILTTIGLTLLTFGCSDDNAGAGKTGESETGDPGEEPVDPLDGEGSVPPDNRLPDTDSVAPSTLGNGLVHDARIRVEKKNYALGLSTEQLQQGAFWSSFVGSNSAMQELGFRPSQVDATIEIQQGLTISDRTLYISDDDANYRTEIVTHGFSTLASEREFEDWEPVELGARPTSIQTFSKDGFVGYSVAWVFDSVTTTPSIPWVMKVGQSEAELENLLENTQLRPISLSSRRRDGVSEYAVILVEADSADHWPANINIPAWQLDSVISSRWQNGHYPFRVTTEDQRPTRVNVLWAPLPPGISVQTRLNLTDTSFTEEDSDWRSRGYHLETTNQYEEGGQRRHAAVWVRYEPYLRWLGSEYPPDDSDYDTKYKMFHDQILRTAANLTDIDCSDGQPCPTGTVCYACPANTPCFYESTCTETLAPQSTGCEGMPY